MEQERKAMGLTCFEGGGVCVGERRRARALWRGTVGGSEERRSEAALYEKAMSAGDGGVDG